MRVRMSIRVATIAMTIDTEKALVKVCVRGVVFLERDPKKLGQDLYNMHWILEFSHQFLEESVWTVPSTPNHSTLLLIRSIPCYQAYAAIQQIIACMHQLEI